MAGQGNYFLLVTILVLVTILLVFGMKYFSSGRQARVRSAAEGSYRELAEKAAAVQAASAATLAALQEEFSEMKARLTSIEKVLREVE